MKLFKFWTSVKVNIMIEGEKREINVWGGSNASVEDAKIHALEKVNLIQNKINGDHSAFSGYEADIREEILKIVDDKSIISRNRYGAQILNVENLMIIDIDKSKFELASLFKRGPKNPKEKIYEMVRKLAASPRYNMFGFRIYETFQGARVIVLGRDFDAGGDTARDIMREFNADPLYALLCAKQNCFRARLTPKPARMKMKGFRVQYPRETEDPKFTQWLKDYENQSRNFSVCKFIEQVGANYSPSETVRLHDDMTGVSYNLPLA
jgi:hypothetical protein